jgi:hypothetical protein
MESSVEALRLRRMRVHNEISLTKEKEADRAEDLEALREELLRLSKQIDEVERQRLFDLAPSGRIYKGVEKRRN